MKKYWLVHASFLGTFLLLSCLFWETPHSFTVQLAGLAAAAPVAVVMQLVIRDRFLREVKAVDPQAYERLSKTLPYGKVDGLNIEKDCPYKEETRELIDWWSDYTWISVATVAVPFILLFFSGR